VAVPLLVSRIRFIRLPVVVGEILAGILIGRSGLDLVQTTPTLNFLASFGFTFLMFLSGLEVDFAALAANGGNGSTGRRTVSPIRLALLSFAATIILAVGFGRLFTELGLTSNPLMMGLILTTTSLGIVVPILKERGLTASAYGQTVMVCALLADFTTLILLGVLVAIIRRGVTLDLLLILVLLIAFMLASRLGRKMGRIPVLPRIISELSHATAQIEVRGALALMVIWSVLAEALGMEVIVGAFLAGSILSAASRGQESQLRDRLDAIGYGFFIPIFFITVGARFDLQSLIASRRAVLLVPALILAAYVVKVLPALVFRLAHPWRETLAAGALLSSRLSLIVAAAAIALNLGLITNATHSAIILVAIVTCLLSPVLFSKALPPVTTARREGVVVLGTDQLATLLARRLRATGETVSIIGRDQEQIRRLRKEGFNAIAGNPDKLEVLETAGLHKARALIALANSPELVLSVCSQARGLCQVPEVIARADDPQLAQVLRAENVKVVQPSLAIALAFEGALHFPAAWNVLIDQHDNVEFMDVNLRNPDLADRPMRRLRLPGNALVVGIQRQGEVLVPHGDTVVRRDDVLLLVGSPASLEEARNRLSRPPEV